MKLTLAAFSLAGLVSLTATGRGATFITTSPTASFFPGQGYTLGTFFTVGAVSETVSALGMWDDQANGFAFSHDIKIWNTTTHLAVATATVSAGTSAVLDAGSVNGSGGFRYQSITPVSLLTGQAYVIGAYYSSADSSDTQATPAGGQQVSAAFTNISSAFTASASLGSISEPNSTLVSGVGYAGPSFQYTAAPEPSAFGLLGMTAMGLLGMRRRVR